MTRDVTSAAAGLSPPRSIGRAVAVGGGHGTARTLRALESVADHVTAVITVADDGGSSGRLRRDLGVPAPGDLRMALTALAPDSELAGLVAHRFDRGELAGHSLGNLLLVALLERCEGDLITALDRLAVLLGARGRVLPCTSQPVSLHAIAAGGDIRGQAAVAATPRIERVSLDPPAPAAPIQVLDAIGRADLVVLGPGSLYTSVLPNLMVPAVADALTSTPAMVALVANLRAQPGETEGMGLADHLDALREHVPALRIDVLVAHDGAPPRLPVRPLDPGEAVGHPLIGRVVTADLLDGADGHDPATLATVLAGIVRVAPGR